MPTKNTPTKGKDAAYIALQNKVKNALADFFEQKKLKVEELMAILYLFSFTETEQELQLFIAMFSDSFPVLKSLMMEREMKMKESFDQELAAIVQIILKKDPILATKVAKEVAKKGMTMEKIQKKYPEVKQYVG